MRTLVLNDSRVSQFENEVRVVKGNLFGGRHLVFILHWIIYSVKKGEPERMLGSHIGLPIMLEVNSRTFQEVDVPSGRTFQGYSVFHRIPRATLSQVSEFQTLTFVKGNRFETQ